MRRLTPCLAALALLVGACGDDDDDTATATSAEVTSSTTEDTGTTSTSTTASTTTSTSEATSTTAADGGADGVQLDQSCESPDGFTVSYPSDWEAVSDCGQFGPAPLDEPTPNTDERTGVVSAFIDAVPFEEVAEPTEGDTARQETTVAGHPAVRVEGTQSGAGLYPEGTAYVRWLVDLSEVRGDATLFLDAYDLGYDVEFERAVQVLDEMARTVEVGDG
jgi:hypothetical protein